MGFLLESIPLDWDDAIDKLKYVREHGIEQFINLFFENRNIKQDLLKYGDEIEYAVCRLVGKPNDPNRTVKISLRSPEIINALHAFEAHGRNHGMSEADMCSWVPEYGRWMLEGVPSKPFEGEGLFVESDEGIAAFGGEATFHFKGRGALLKTCETLKFIRICRLSNWSVRIGVQIELAGPKQLPRFEKH